MTYGWASGFRMSAQQATRELVAIVTFGSPVAYAATLLWGAPLLYGLRRLGWLRVSTLVAAGAIGGAVVAAWIAATQGEVMFRVQLPIAGGAALGALVAGGCWLAGQEHAS